MATVENARQAAQLPVGTKIGIPLGGNRKVLMTTAEKRAGVFRDGRAGWFINGADFPVTDSQLFTYGRGWVTSEPVDGECSACEEPHGDGPCAGWA